MPSLLLTSSRWPHGQLNEFVDPELPHLLNHFDSIRVVPRLPRGPVVWDVPKGVEIDYSLAEALTPQRTRLGERARFVRAARHFPYPNPAGIGFTREQLARDYSNPLWWRLMLMARAESNIVRQWASTQQPPDIAYTFWLGSITLGMRQAWPNVPIVSRAHNADLYPYSIELNSLPYQRSWVDACDMVACVAEHGREFLADLYPEARDKLTVRRLGIPDPGVLAPPGDYPNSLRILSASSIRPNKRVGLIAQAVMELARRGIRTEWLHLGTGDGFAEVEASLAGAPELLSWQLPGMVNVQEVRRQMESEGHDVFVNVSSSEGVPVSIMEAQSVGLPTVATDVGGSREVAGDDLNVVLQPDLTPDVLADAITAAAEMDPSLRSLRRERWSENYNAPKNYEAFAAELASIATAGRQQAAG